MLDLDRLAAALTGHHGGTITGDAARQEVSEIVEPHIQKIIERDGVTRTEAVLRLVRGGKWRVRREPWRVPSDHEEAS